MTINKVQLMQEVGLFSLFIKPALAPCAQVQLSAPPLPFQDAPQPGPAHSAPGSTNLAPSPQWSDTYANAASASNCAVRARFSSSCSLAVFSRVPQTGSISESFIAFCKQRPFLDILPSDARASCQLNCLIAHAKSPRRQERFISFAALRAILLTTCS